MNIQLIISDTILANDVRTYFHQNKNKCYFSEENIDKYISHEIPPDVEFEKIRAQSYFKRVGQRREVILK